jgi:hypothetical protein
MAKMKSQSRFWTCLPLLAVLCGLAIAQADRAEQQRQERVAKNGALFEARHKMIHLDRTVDKAQPNAQGEIDLSRNTLYDYVDMSEDFTPEQELHFLAKKAEAVVQGTTERQSSFLTPMRTTVFSEWDIKVERVFKNTSSIPVLEGSLITVVRPGGRLIWGWRTVFAREPAFPDYSLKRSYVFFLSGLPDTQCFRPTKAFELAPNRVQYMGDPGEPTKLRPFSASVSSDEFLAAVERSVLQ